MMASRPVTGSILRGLSLDGLRPVWIGTVDLRNAAVARATDAPALI